MYGATVIFLGQSEAPLMIAPYLKSLRHGQVFTVMTARVRGRRGSTLVGYSLLGAPLEYLLAATVMNAPAGAADGQADVARPARPDDASRVEEAADAEHEAIAQIDVREVRDEESTNAIDAIGRGAMAGGRIAVTVGALLIAFVALIAMANGILGGDRQLVRVRGPDLREAARLGARAAGLAARGARGREAVEAGAWIGEKTVLNEFVAYASFGPEVDYLSDGHGRGRDVRPGRLRELHLDRHPDRHPRLAGAGTTRRRWPGSDCARCSPAASPTSPTPPSPASSSRCSRANARRSLGRSARMALMTRGKRAGVKQKQGFRWSLLLLAISTTVCVVAWDTSCTPPSTSAARPATGAMRRGGTSASLPWERLPACSSR